MASFLGSQMHCLLSCGRVTLPMLCNLGKYSRTCVHPSLITVLSATIEVNVAQLFVTDWNLKIYNVELSAHIKSNHSLSSPPQQDYKIRKSGQHCYGDGPRQPYGNFQFENQPSCWVESRQLVGLVTLTRAKLNQRVEATKLQNFWEVACVVCFLSNILKLWLLT